MNQTKWIEDRGDWIQTYVTGTAFYPIDPDPNDVHIEDIAWSLSMQCRYTGHCRWWYSVAEHSMLVAQAVPKEYRFIALMHDATEAYLADIARPVKGYIAGYKEAEIRLWDQAIAPRFNLPLFADIPPIVKEMDTRILLNEKELLLGPEPQPWAVEGDPIPDLDFVFYWPNESYKPFLELFHKWKND